MLETVLVVLAAVVLLSGVVFLFRGSQPNPPPAEEDKDERLVDITPPGSGPGGP